ncbi:MAG: serine/threonine protein kinase, partial [Lachnospiraceae bacterium]|nr:serine/threonine protein kinase [Lachnospiraceae bacterium]
NVAVKVLKQEFSENASFVSKFRIEAQAAGNLMDQNIVNVYDVGEENGIYYIVMELVGESP